MKLEIQSVFLRFLQGIILSVTSVPSVAGAFSRSAFLCILCVGLPISWTLSTAQSPKPELKKQVDRLVAQLASADANKQAAAAADLLKLGTDVLPYLPGHDAKLSAEQQKQIDEIRRTLQDALARKDLAPRRCTIRDQAISLKDALSQLAKQTGIQVDVRTEEKTASPSLKLDLQNATFWQALDTIAREADLRVLVFHARQHGRSHRRPLQGDFDQLRRTVSHHGEPARAQGRIFKRTCTRSSFASKSRGNRASNRFSSTCRPMN